MQADKLSGLGGAFHLVTVLMQGPEMKTQYLLLAILTVLGLVGAASADNFYNFDSVTVTYPDDVGGAFWPESNLIQGPGIGFDEEEPHDKIGGGQEANWVTTADCGFPADYIECVGMPVIELDLGADRRLSEISAWGYEDTNTNGMREFSLRFATAAEGPGGYGTSINYNPTFLVDDFFEFDALERRSFAFSENVTAQFVEMTVTDNYFDDPGDGSGENGWGPGGDRVGIGEIAFQAPDDFVPPDPPKGDDFYDIDDIVASTEDTDLWPAANLIQGPGEGFNEGLPHQLLASGEAGSWVTEACAFPCDYLENFDPPELIIDLGEDVALDEVNVWGYASSNANGVLEFELEFATTADGDDGFGDTISYNPTFSDVEIDPSPRQHFPFEDEVTARYVKFTATDNYFEEPGDGSGELGRPAGGDRVGFSEIAFPIPVDPLAPLDDGSLTDPQERLDYVHNVLGTWMGDSNVDGEFNSGDLVAVFSAGKYELDEKAGWAEGDWDGDMRFGSGDLVVAFSDGGYEVGPRPEGAAIPEPNALVLVLLSCLGLLVIRRR